MTDLISLESTVRNAAAWFPLADWTLLEITGPDRHRFLHSFCTQDIKGMPADSVREAFVTNVKGRILGHLLVLNEAERLTLLTVPGVAAGLLRHLQIYLLGLEAEIRDVSSERSAICLMGPQISNVIPTAICPLPQDLNTLQSQSQSSAVAAVTVARVDLLSVPNWLLLVPRNAVANIEQVLQDAGVVRVDAVLFDVLRIEAGFPWYGRDLSEDYIAQEAARTRQTINFKKGCYLGQEPIARLDAMGHTNRELRAIQIAGHPDISAGAEVRVGETVIGTLTSVATSASFEDTVALGILRVKLAVPGTKVDVVGADGTLASGQIEWPTINR